ncbi:YcnI family protein [Paenibacillus turpanensis]|uniref:YcnI family copper-binding membrane protein n=1 Tax=Paenibacillus turpanensis TaxID=2689078 RepID=UPI00140940A4|nr:YcnI family protein [Paenibacillus turpanensis]
MKKIAVFLMLLLSFTLYAGIASAHVVVYPREATQGSYEKFAVRVPTEKEVATTKVEVKIPAEVNVSRFEPKPGWSYTFTKDANGKIESVVWTAEGPGLSATEFGEFYMSGKVAADAKAIVWKAYQTYADGSVVEWIGAEGADKPASVTAVKAKAAGTDSHGHDTGAAEASEPAAAGGVNLPLILSAAALVLSLVALIAALSKRAK